MLLSKRLLVHLFLVAPFAVSLQQPPTPPSLDLLSTRRGVFQTAAAGIASSSLLLGDVTMTRKPALAVESPTTSDTPLQVYRVLADASEALNPTLQTVEPTSFVQTIVSNLIPNDNNSQQNLGGGGAVWLGEHHNQKKDHMLQAKLIRELHQQMTQRGRPVAIGFEQFQVQYQPVLDEFVQGKLCLDELQFLCQWSKRWVWPFEGYKEIFTTAQELKIPLVALNVNSEDLALVERGGLPALPIDTLHSYITDPAGFAQFSSGSDFSTYVDYVIRPSYDLHLKLGLLRNTMSGEPLDAPQPFRNFFSGRILWDETMASRAHRWTQSNPGGLLVGLVGADHVKFGNGIPGRYARMAAAAGDSSSSLSSSSVSVLLNPTLVDSRPPGSLLGMPQNIPATATNSPERITLQLRYLKEGIDRNSEEGFLPSSTGGVLPLADYLVVG